MRVVKPDGVVHYPFHIQIHTRVLLELLLKGIRVFAPDHQLFDAGSLQGERVPEQEGHLCQILPIAIGFCRQ